MRCLFALAVLQVLQVVLAYRTGSGTCFAVPADVNPMSFSFYDDAYGADMPILSANVTQYVPGQVVNITLSGGPDPLLKGILLYATTGNATDSKVGSFQDLVTSKYRLLNCGEGNATVTHSTRNRTPLPSFNWVSPANGTGTVTFHAVVSIGPTGDASLWTVLEPFSLPESTGGIVIPPTSSPDTGLGTGSTGPGATGTGPTGSTSTQGLTGVTVISSTGTIGNATGGSTGRNGTKSSPPPSSSTGTGSSLSPLVMNSSLVTVAVLLLLISWA